MEKTFTIQQVKKLIFTTSIISILATWCLASYAIPKIEEHSLEARMQSNTKSIIGDEASFNDRLHKGLR
jgi:7-keto-8-aminopelargonate synthetase-like enzyme